MTVYHGHTVGVNAVLPPKPHGGKLKSHFSLGVKGDFLLENINSPQDKLDEKFHHFVCVPKKDGELMSIIQNKYSIYKITDVYQKFEVTMEGERYYAYVSIDSCPWGEKDCVEFGY